MNTETFTIPLSDELLDAEIPCGGILHAPIRRSCSQAAVLRAHGHGCTNEWAKTAFKCLECWQVWYSHHAGLIAQSGRFQCVDCKRIFHDVEPFVSYRPF